MGCLLLLHTAILDWDNLGTSFSHRCRFCSFALPSLQLNIISILTFLSLPSSRDQTMAEYSSLLSDLSENITNEDLEQLKSACKEDIPEDQSNNITSSKEWFSYLEKNDKLAQGERHKLDPLLVMVLFICGLNWCQKNLYEPKNLLIMLPNADNLSYIEHIFEISRRPDLLTRVIEYRTKVLKISEDDEIDTKLTRIPSAKKYKGSTLCLKNWESWICLFERLFPVWFNVLPNLI